MNVIILSSSESSFFPVLLLIGKQDCPKGEEEICSTQCGVPGITRTNLKKLNMDGKIIGGREVTAWAAGTQ